MPVVLKFFRIQFFDILQHKMTVLMDTSKSCQLPPDEEQPDCIQVLHPHKE